MDLNNKNIEEAEDFEDMELEWIDMAKWEN